MTLLEGDRDSPGSGIPHTAVKIQLLETSEYSTWIQKRCYITSFLIAMAKYLTRDNLFLPIDSPSWRETVVSDSSSPCCGRSMKLLGHILVGQKLRQTAF